jgi:hypothetical protein
MMCSLLFGLASAISQKLQRIWPRFASAESMCAWLTSGQMVSADAAKESQNKWRQPATISDTEPLQTPREPSHKHLPIDDIEPLTDDDNGYREAARIGLRLINNIMHLIHTSRHNPVTFWAIAYALGLDITEGRSMTAQASRLGVTRAALSKSQQAMRRKLGLPTNTNNKPESAVKTYKTNRDNQL